jgi:hypothetical protein
LFVLQFWSWLKYPPSYLVWVTVKEEESSRDKIDQRKIKWKMKKHTHTHTHFCWQNCWHPMQPNKKVEFHRDFQMNDNCHINNN